MNGASTARVGLVLAAAAVLMTVMKAGRDSSEAQLQPYDIKVRDYAARQVSDGRQIFRFDTFGSEAFWGGALRLHEAIAGSANGGTVAACLRSRSGTWVEDTR